MKWIRWRHGRKNLKLRNSGLPRREWPYWENGAGVSLKKKPHFQPTKIVKTKLHSLVSCSTWTIVIFFHDFCQVFLDWKFFTNYLSENYPPFRSPLVPHFPKVTRSLEALASRGGAWETNQGRERKPGVGSTCVVMVKPWKACQPGHKYNQNRRHLRVHTHEIPKKKSQDTRFSPVFFFSAPYLLEMNIIRPRYICNKSRPSGQCETQGFPRRTGGDKNYIGFFSRKKGIIFPAKIPS